jgi:putative transposase
VHLLGVTTNPVMGWVVQRARNFTSDLEDADRRFRFLVRDRDTKFTASFDEVFKASGIFAASSERLDDVKERYDASVAQERMRSRLGYRQMGT